MKDIKALRKLLGIRQVQMAEWLSMDQSNYCNVENGRYLFSDMSEIRGRCFNVLLPELNRLIQEKTKELADLSSYRNGLNHE